MNIAEPKTLEDLEEENENLRFQLNELRGENASIHIYHLLKLTPTQCRILHFLMNHEWVSRQQLYGALYGNRNDTEQPLDKTIDIHLHHVRRVLTQYGVSIENNWGQGWRISPENKTLIIDAINQKEIENGKEESA